MEKEKKPFKETRIGKFLTEKAPKLAGNILGIAGNLTGIKVLSSLGDMIRKSEELSPADKELALKELDLDIKEMKEVTERWKADMQSDSWLSKNVRPLVLLWSMLFVSVMTILDSIDNAGVTVKDAWITLWSTLLVTMIIAYFGSRGYEKAKKIGKLK